MPSVSSIVNTYRPDLDRYESLYKHFHSHPELSFQEQETANTIQSRLSKLDVFDIHSDIGGYGIAAVFKNSSSDRDKTILLRADIDALPVKEQSGLDYASHVVKKDPDGNEKPVMHACGHDVHITSLLAAAELLVAAKNEWQGTLILVFQPAEEKGKGARKMVDDGLYDKVPVPDVVLGGHVMPGRAGSLGTRRGRNGYAADSFHLTLRGRSGHASMPHRALDPIVLASSIVIRLQTIVSREVSPEDFAVVTFGAINSGDTENIIPERADLKINIRTLSEEVRQRVLKSVRRIIDAECEASGANEAARSEKAWELTPTATFPLLVNDTAVTDILETVFSEHFGESEHTYTRNAERLSGSEDFGILATSVGRPSCFWLYGGTEPELWDRAVKEGRVNEDVPGNHSGFFAPEIGRTLKTGVDAYAAAALAWLAVKDRT